MEFDILLLLARRPGQVFSARQIYEAVAADSYDASWTGISSMIYKLRRKLGAGIIETRCALLFDGYFLFSMINSQSHDILRLGDY